MGWTSIFIVGAGRGAIVMGFNVTIGVGKVVLGVGV